ncbi:MAG: hypothetical protein ACYTCU_11015 [Planctomycetota bacterium]
MKTRNLWMVALLLVATACGGGSSSDPAGDARGALNKGDFAEARTICDDNLSGADAKTAAALKLIRVKALASLGDSAAVQSSIDDLPAASVTTALFVDLAGRLQESGELVGAIEVADAGTKRFPDNKDDFAKVIEGLKASAAAGGDDAATEKLRSLGYL